MWDTYNVDKKFNTYNEWDENDENDKKEEIVQETESVKPLSLSELPSYPEADKSIVILQNNILDLFQKNKNLYD